MAPVIPGTERLLRMWQSELYSPNPTVYLSLPMAWHVLLGHSPCHSMFSRWLWGWEGPLLVER